MPAKKSASPIWFVTGSEESEVKKAATALATKLAPGDDPFSTETIDGAAESADDACRRLAETRTALLTLPLFGGEKLVWLKNVNFLSDSVVGSSESVTKEWESFLELLQGGLPDGVKLLLNAIDPDKRRTIYKSLTKLANTEVYDKPDFGWGATEADVVAWVAEKAAERGLLFDADALETLAARVGVDARQLSIEFDKLSLAANPGTRISLQTVQDLVPMTRQGAIFDLGNCILKKDLPGALNTVEQLLRQKETPLGILLAGIIPTLRNLLLAADLLQRHRLRAPAEAHFFGKSLERLGERHTAHLPRKKDGSLNSYPIGLAAMAAHRYSLAGLQKAFIKASELNVRLVSSSTDGRLLLDEFLTELMA